MIQISKVSNISPNRILIIQTAFLGDVILTLPLLQKTKNLFPESKIDFITIPASRNLLETHPDINELLIYDKHKTEGGFLNFVKWINKIRNSNYDLALVPHRSIRSALMAIPAKQRIGFNRSAGKIFFNQIIQYQKDRHEINRNLFLLKPFGVDPDEKVFPQINFTKSDSLVVSQWKKNLKLKSTSKIIAVAPGSVWATKRWTLEGYCKVINDRCKRGFTVVLI